MSRALMVLRCKHFRHLSGECCCDSCHDDWDGGYGEMCEMEPPMKPGHWHVPRVYAHICCRVAKRIGTEFAQPGDITLKYHPERRNFDAVAARKAWAAVIRRARRPEERR